MKSSLNVVYCRRDYKENNPKSEKKGKMMDDHKSTLLETIEHVSKFAGTLAGQLVVHGKEFLDCAKSVATAKMEPKQKPSSKVTEYAKSQTEKKIEEKKATSKKIKVKKKTEKPKPSSGAQSSPKTEADEKTDVIAKSKKRQPRNTKKKKSNKKTSRPTTIN